MKSVNYNIALPFDGLEQTLRSANYALKIAKIIGGCVNVVHVINSKAYNAVKKVYGFNDTKARIYCKKRVEGILEDIKKQLKSRNIKYSLNIIFSEHIEEGISNFCKKNKIDLCILQPSQYNHPKLIGDLANRIEKKLDKPALFIKTKKIFGKNPVFLIPIDEKEKNLVSLYKTRDLIKQLKGKIIFYHTTWPRDGFRKSDPLQHCLPEVLNNIKKAEKFAEGIEFKTIIKMDEIIEGGIIQCAVKNNADFIVMASSDSLIGGKPELVLKNSAYPLIIVK